MADPKVLSSLMLGAQIILASASLVVLGRLLFKRFRGHPLIPCEVRSPAPWSVVDIYLVLLLFFGVSWLASALTQRLLAEPNVAAALLGSEESHPKTVAESRQAALSVFGGTLRNLLIVPLSVLCLCWRVGATRHDLGLSLARERYDLKIGILAFLAAALPVLGLQLALSQFIEPKHSIEDWLQTAPGYWPAMVCGLSAVLIAPLAEELLFRVVLQGWLESRLAPGWGLAAASTSTPLPSTLESWLPVVISSALFSLMHLGQGPAPIPLFLFAMVLGYLYRQTHRIWPAVLVHAFLNAWSMIMVMLEIHVKSL